MINSILERSGRAEVLFRKVATAVGPLKKRIKRLIRSNAKTEIVSERNDEKIDILRRTLNTCGIKKGDIVLVHSSFDGLRSLGLSVEELIDFILDVFSDMTVVFATYPIEPMKEKEVYKYNPDRTLCWTGMLPNLFLKREGVIRSLFPYNTLAAKGKYAKAMMTSNLSAETPHGKFSPWEFCRQYHAKILFLGTTSREANTMAIHMIPDIMGDDWPIKNWYEERKYVITVEGEKVYKTIKVQKGSWYQYVNEYKTDKILKDTGDLIDISVDDIPLEIVPDCYEMVEHLINRCKSGMLMYSIPQKHYK